MLNTMSRDIRASVARDFESATRDLALRPAEEATTAMYEIETETILTKWIETSSQPSPWQKL